MAGPERCALSGDKPTDGATLCVQHVGLQTETLPGSEFGRGEAIGAVAELAGDGDHAVVRHRGDLGGRKRAEHVFHPLAAAAAARRQVPRAPYPDAVLVEQSKQQLARAQIGIDQLPYKRSKFLAEEVVRQMVSKAGLPAVIVNPSTPVGPRDIKPTPTGRLIVEAARGRIPAFVDTGLNVVHVNDVAAGHLLAFERGEVGERYILGGENLALAEILAVIAQLCGRPPPRLRLPHGLVLPLAYGAEAWARLTRGAEPFVTVDGLRMSKKWMFFSSAKAETALGYRARPAEAALAVAVAWFREAGYLE